MRRFLIFLLLLQAGVAFALNLPTITTANLPRIEAGLQFAKSNRITWVRLNIGMAEATKGSTLDTYAAKRAGQLCAQHGRKVILVDYTQIGNTKYARSFSTQDETSLWTNWKQDEALGLFQDCHNPNGIYEWLWTFSVKTSVAMVAAFEEGFGRAVDILQIENEPGETVNAFLMPGEKYGRVNKTIVSYLDFKSRSIKEMNQYVSLAAPAWETETMAGLMEQVKAEDKSFWGRFAYQAINWYEAWELLDTPLTWAIRALAKLRAFIYDVWWPGRPVIVSELGAIGCPKEFRLKCWQEFNRLKFSRIHSVLWHDWDSLEWGIVVAE